MFILNPSRFASAGGGGNGLLTGLQHFWPFQEESASGTIEDVHGGNSPSYSWSFVPSGPNSNFPNRPYRSETFFGYTGNLPVRPWNMYHGSVSYAFWFWCDPDDISLFAPTQFMNEASNTAQANFRPNGEVYFRKYDGVGTQGNRLYQLTLVPQVGSNIAGWYYITFVWDASLCTWSVYVNGVLDLQVNWPESGYTGTDPYLDHDPFRIDGLVGFGLWSRALSAADAVALYNSGNGLPYSSFTT